MEWPHDPDGEDASEGGRLYGQAILAKKLDGDEDFPLDVQAFSEAIGHHPIRLDSETVVPASELLEGITETQLDDLTAFHGAVGKAMRASGHWTYELE